MIDLKHKQYFLFDMDGTLVDLEQLNFTSFQSAVQKEFGVEMLFSEYMTHIAGVGSTAGIASYLQSKELDLSRVAEIVDKYRKRKRYYLKNHFTSSVSVKEGVFEFLEYLRKEGKKLAVGTSTGRQFATRILKGTKLFGQFDAVVSVNDVAKTKPYPDIFEEALARIGGTKPEAVVFEDSANGALSAVNAGIDLIVVANPGYNDTVVASYPNHIRDYRELIPNRR